MPRKMMPASESIIQRLSMKPPPIMMYCEVGGNAQLTCMLSSCLTYPMRRSMWVMMKAFSLFSRSSQKLLKNPSNSEFTRGTLSFKKYLPSSRYNRMIVKLLKAKTMSFY